MKRWLIGVPVVSLVVYAIVRAIIGGGDASGFYRWEAIALELLAAAGCILAARSFASGEHLRAAWLIYGSGFFALVVSAFVANAHETTAVTWVRVAMTFFTNATGVGALWLFARTSSVAGLELPGSPAARRAAIVAGVALALFAAGPPIIFGAKEVLEQHRLTSWIPIFSSTGDLLSFSLMAPLIMTALALRGGRISWVWFLLGMSILAWVLYDAQDTVGLFFHRPTEDNPEWVQAITEPFRLLGCTLTFSAGLAQARLTE